MLTKSNDRTIKNELRIMRKE